MYSWLLLQKFSLFVIDVIVSSGCYIARLECDLHVCSSNQGEWLAEVNCSDLKNKRKGTVGKYCYICSLVLQNQYRQ